MKKGIHIKDNSIDKNSKILPETLQADAEFILAYSEFMRTLPKEISPQNKARYEHFLERFKLLVASSGGNVQSLIDKKCSEAWIKVTMPFLELSSAEEFQLLMDISKSAEYIKIHSSKNGEICFTMRLPYFNSCISEKNLDRIFDDSGSKH